MKYFKKILLLAVLLFSLMITKAQDIHFSQFYASPLSLAPYQTGNFKGDWRFTNNYRNQWRGLSIPFRTVSIGYDRKFFIQGEQISAGIYFVNDNSGAAALDVSKIYLSVGYQMEYNDHNFLFGFQPGFVLKSFKTDELTFPDQFDMTSGYFNSQLNNNENNLEQGLSYVDINLGAAWRKKFKTFEPLLGISVFHINAPKESFQPDNNHLPMRTSFYGGGYYDITSQFFLEPHLLYMRHKRASEFLLGTNIGYKFPKNDYKIKSVYFGGLYRDGLNFKTDAFIGIVGARVHNFDVGFSYDFNISSLKVAQTKGAFEISIIYIGVTNLLQKITIPCDRY